MPASRGESGGTTGPLRALCAVLDSPCHRGAAGALAARLREQLERRLAEGARSLADDLRRELPLWQGAALHLGHLAQSELLPSPSAAKPLRADLEQVSAFLIHVVSLLEQIATPADTPACLHTELPGVESGPQENLGGLAPGTGTLTGTAIQEVSSTHREAEAEYELGQACRRRKDYAKALAHYTEAIRLSPRSVDAYFRRGQVHRLAGNSEEAVADFGRVVQIDSRHAEAYFRRGEALARLGRIEQAIDDYSEAVRLQPRWLLPRHSRGLLRTQCGMFNLAITDFTAILGLSPDNALAHFHRGCAHLASGDSERAVADLGRAVTLSPDNEAARRKLEEARHARPGAPAAATVEVIATATRTVSLPLASTAAPARAPGRAGKGRLALGCPQCGVVLQVPYDRLGHALICPRCARHFRLGPGRKLVAVLPGASRSTRYRRAARLMVVAAVVVVAVLGAPWFFRGPPPAPAGSLPNELEPRAELFVRGWLKKDVFLMRQLSVPGLERDTYRWYVRGGPPAGMPQPADDVKLDVQPRAAREGRTEVLVRIGRPDRNGALELLLTWERRGEAWFFLPPP